MAEPEGDRGDINSCVEHPHGCGVAQCVRSNSFAFQARTECGCSGAMDAKARCDCVATDCSGAALRCEYGVLRLTAGASLDPFAQSARGRWRRGEEGRDRYGPARRSQSGPCPVRLPHAVKLDHKKPARPQDHLAFSFGPRSCAGAALARAEIQETVKAVLDWFPDLRLADIPDPIGPYTGFALRSYSSVHAQFTPVQ